MNCTSCQELLSAYVDGELSPQEVMAVNEHLHGCPICRQERDSLLELKASLGEHYRQESLEDAAVPAHLMARFADSATPKPVGRRRTIMIRALSGAGAIAAAVFLIFTFIPQDGVIATPNELIQRASSHYLGLGDVEYRVTARSEALNLLQNVFGDSSKDEAAETDSAKKKSSGPFRVWLRAPNRILVDQGEKRPIAQIQDPVFAFDGEQFWSYDAEKDVVELTEAPRLEYSHGSMKFDSLDLGDINLIEYLSFGFLGRLQESDSGAGIRETTGPYEKRVGHRKFVVDLREGVKEKDQSESQEQSESAQEKRFLEIQAVLVIDPRSDLIERVTFDFNLGGLSVITVVAELVQVNQGLPDSLFDYRTRVGPNTQVVREQPDTEAAKPEASDPK